MPEFVKPETPMVDKWSAACDQGAMTLRSFLEWLRDVKHVHLATYEELMDTNPCPKNPDLNFSVPRAEQCFAGKLPDGSMCPRCEGNGYVEYKRPAQLFPVTNRDAYVYEFFEVDPVALDNDRRALLEALAAAGPVIEVTRTVIEEPSARPESGRGPKRRTAPRRAGR